MAQVAFDESYKIRSRNMELGAKGFGDYPRAVEIRRADVFEDIAKLLDAIGEISGDVKELLRKRREQKEKDFDAAQ